MRYKEFVAVLIIFCAAGCNKSENPVSNSNNSAPVIQAVIIMPDSVVLGESCIIEVIAVDPDSDKLSYEWESTGNVSESGSRIFFTPNACCSTPVIVIHVKDNKGGSKDTTIQVPSK